MALRDMVARYLQCDPDSLFFYWKGRVALYALLRSFGVCSGDEVIVPAYTCVVVPNAVLYLGARAAYVDIDPQTFNMDVSRLKSSIGPRTRAIVCQNTYGLSSGLEEIVSLAKSKGIRTIEDCTHGFGGLYNGVPNGRTCDAAFFSTQWNKPFSTGIGGFAIVNNPSLREPVLSLEGSKAPVTLSDRMSLRGLYVARKYILNRYTYWPLVSLYRALSGSDIVLGSSTGMETTSISMPSDYFKEFSCVQEREGMRALRGFQRLQEARKRNAERYTQFLEARGKNHVPRSQFANHSFLKYPLLVRERGEFMKRAQRDRVPLGEWFISPLHPVRDHLERWGFHEAEYPNASFIARHVVNLPTETDDVAGVESFLSANLADILEVDCIHQLTRNRPGELRHTADVSGGG
jgi:perosamine synthetase